MKVIDVNGIKLTIVRNLSSIKYEGKNGRTHIWEILCIHCGGLKVGHRNNFLRGVGLAHPQCAREKVNEIYLASINERELIIDRIYRITKTNAKRLKRKFNLSKNTIGNIIYESCTYCGAEPLQTYNNYKIRFTGIDRVDNDKGYIKSNCVPCCKICNTAKHALSYKDFMDWLNIIIKFQTSKKELIRCH